MTLPEGISNVKHKLNKKKMEAGNVFMGVVKFILKVFLMCLWGVTRIGEIILHELNAWLKNIINQKNKIT